MDFPLARTTRPTQHDEIADGPRRAVFAEFELPPLHTVQDVLSGHITWDELGAQRVS